MNTAVNALCIVIRTDKSVIVGTDQRCERLLLLMMMMPSVTPIVAACCHRQRAAPHDQFYVQRLHQVCSYSVL